MHNTDPNRPADQINAMCHNAWRGRKDDQCPQVPTLAIVTRLNNLKDRLIQIFGVAGLKYFNATLAALGVTLTEKGDYLYNGDISNLPFVKAEKDGSFEFSNMIFGEVKFEKIDKANRTVSGYANTIVSDCDKDIILPEAYAESVREYMEFPVVYYTHQHRQPPFGTIDKQHIDEIGWWVKTKVAKNPSIYWEMVLDHRVNGYSIGGRFRATPVRIGSARIWSVGIHITDLSACARPCNKLCFWGMVSESKLSRITLGDQKLADRLLTRSGLQKKKNRFNKGDNKKMSEEQTEKEPNETNDEETVENEENTENPENTENEENKTAFEIFKEAIKNAKTPKDTHEAYLIYARSQVVEEEKDRLLEAAENAEVKKKEREISKLPERIEELEALVKEQTDLLREQGSRLLKMEEAPDRKDTGDIEEDDEVGDPIFKKYLEAGGGEWGFRAAEKEIKKIRKGEAA